jgi:cytochrome c oxidase assembly protein subunit 15
MKSELHRKIVGGWLMIGLVMILIQIMLGGITRLTGSGLSITEWKVIMGAIPPMNQAEWNEAFDAYKKFPQYRLMNSNMDLAGFKKIYWWEYVHRLWARLFVPVFLIPLAFFLWKKMIDRRLLLKLLLIFVLGGLQGLLGWIMVSSGLIDKPWVDPLNLSMHLLLALLLICYLLWIALEVYDLRPASGSVARFRPMLVWMLVLLAVQIFYGGLMAGNHAALFYPTFPKFGDRYIPEALFVLTPRITNFFQNVGMIQLIHRTLGIVIAVIIIFFYYAARGKSGSDVFRRAVGAMPVLVLLQVLLGIVTLLGSLGKIPVVPAVVHQLVAVLLLLTNIILLYQVSYARERQ